MEQINIKYFEPMRKIKPMANYDKFDEEVREFLWEYEKGCDIDYRFKESIVSEFYDVVQVMLHMMRERGLTLEEIKEGNEKHFNKLFDRGWK